MRWSYKTVHYELKKEGLLGNAFLDESEIELSLNEYGKAGWELVSILETQEGLIAVFKQPLGVGRQTANFSEEEAERQYVPLRPKQDDFTLEPHSRQGGKRAEKAESPAAPIDEYEIILDDREEDEKDSSPPKGDIGSIRIE
jgi:Domain of unknown function (DUF4177)